MADFDYKYLHVCMGKMAQKWEFFGQKNRVLLTFFIFLPKKPARQIGEIIGKMTNFRSRLTFGGQSIRLLLPTGNHSVPLKFNDNVNSANRPISVDSANGAPLMGLGRPLWLFTN